MTAEEKIKVDDNWKELVKNMVDKCDNLNDFQKEIMKFCLEMQHEENNYKSRKQKQSKKIFLFHKNKYLWNKNKYY